MQQTVDPYAVLQLPRTGFTHAQLKANYKRLALALHPDKNNPTSTALFQVLTNCYKQLSRELSLREQERSHLELRAQSRAFAEAQAQAPRQNVRLAAAAADVVAGPSAQAQAPRAPPLSAEEARKRFNLAKFNQVFEDHRLVDGHQDGYARWLQEGGDWDDAGGGGGGGRNLHVVRYKAPEALPAQNTLPFYELGVERVANHSAENMGSRGLHYTDLKRALTTNKLVDPAVVAARKEYRTVNELEADRERTAAQPLSEKEWAALERRRRREEKAEQERQARQQRFDATAFDVYERVNRLLLG
jgi:hypothetical protein